MLRLAVVTPRFWPLIDDRTLHLLRLAQALARHGCEVTVVTPRWTRAWPTRLALDHVGICRLAGSAAGGFGQMRWMISLGRWLRGLPPQPVLVAGLKREAMTVLSAAEKLSLKAVLVAGEDDLPWQQATGVGRRVALRCQQAPAIVAPNDALADALGSAGYQRQTISVIERGSCPLHGRSSESRAAARLSLAAVNYDLATTPNSIVALAVGSLDETHRFGDLIRAWRIVSAHRPESKLWIVGDGPARQRLYQQIGDLDQRFRVMIPGMFERLDELLLACDLLLMPGAHDVPPLAMLDALASGIPVIAAECGASRPFKASVGLSLFPPGDIQALAGCVVKTIENCMQPQAASANAPGESPAAEAGKYLALIDRLQSQI